MGESVLTKSPLQLSGNALKILAAISMTLDHVGLVIEGLYLLLNQ